MAQTKKPSAANRRSFLTGVAAAAALTGPVAFLETKVVAKNYQPHKRKPGRGKPPWPWYGPWHKPHGDLCGTRGPSPYGPIYPARDEATGLQLIMLPKGFKYSTFSWKGDKLDDGNICASGHDGMAIVKTSGGPPWGKAYGYWNNKNSSPTYTLIRNQEVFGVGTTPIAPDYNYDNQAGGGTTVLTWKDGKLLEHHVSISGTSSNCAGGPSPWGTWITCEETTDIGDEPHGYPFECTTSRVTKPTPLKAMGRFAHEALAFDPRSGHVFMTEDDSSTSSLEPDPADRPRGVSGFYCFVPKYALGGPGSLERGGTLYMAQAIDRDGESVDDLRDPECFSEYDVKWIKIEEPDAEPEQGASGPFLEGRSKDATRFQRLEGCWWDETKRRVVFVDTEAGPIGAQAGSTDRAEGAVWAYDPRRKKLSNLFVSKGAIMPDKYGADNPDNCSVSPRGGIILCEDGGTDDGNGLSLLGLNQQTGQTFEFARNIIEIANADATALAAAGHDPGAIGTGDFSGQEWAGATFSPDGQTLFVNIQTPGITFAITGPFHKGPF